MTLFVKSDGRERVILGSDFLGDEGGSNALLSESEGHISGYRERGNGSEVAVDLPCIK